MTDLADVIKLRHTMRQEPLGLFRPVTPAQFDATTSTALELLISGGNRAGKTYLALMIFASRVLGIPINVLAGNLLNIRLHIARSAEAANEREDYEPLRRHLAAKGNQLQRLPLHFPVSTPSDPKLYWLIGVNSRHIGQRLYKFLFKPGFVMLIRDEATGELRVYNKADPRDRARKAEVVPAEPLIPERFIVPGSWKWERGKKGEDVFTEVTLINGAVIRAYSSAAKPEQGDPIHGALIDEDLSNPQWLVEIQRRTIDHDGWIIWAVWPHRENFALIGLQQRVRGGDNHIQSVQLRMRDNPFITKKSKERSDAMAGSDREIARRDFGDTLLDELAMYAVDDEIHGLGTSTIVAAMERNSAVEGRVRYLGPMIRRIERGEAVTKQELLSQIWDEYRAFPPEWTRYLSVDPSHTRTAVMFGVVPPPLLHSLPIGRCGIIEGELVFERLSAKVIAAAIKEKVGNLPYEAFVMDRRYGRQTAGGRDNTTMQHFAEAFAAAGLFSRLTQNNFMPGVDLPQYRRRVVREFLEGEKPGIPDFFYVRHGTPHLQREFHTYRKHQRQNEEGVLEVVDGPSPFVSQKHDCMAALEYLLAYLVGQFSIGQAYIDQKTVTSVQDGPGLPEFVKQIEAYNERQQAACDYQNQY